MKKMKKNEIIDALNKKVDDMGYTSNDEWAVRVRNNRMKEIARATLFNISLGIEINDLAELIALADEMKLDKEEVHRWR
tara:strand:- start:5713 stop:5949 length:237 start_codon:yes stop_codon:yes gene_type:complete